MKGNQKQNDSAPHEKSPTESRNYSKNNSKKHKISKKELNNLDKFIQSCLDKFKFTEAKKELYDATGENKDLIISHKSTIPDLVIWNKNFNKSKCFEGANLKHYIPFPRFLFYLHIKAKTKNEKPKLNNNLKQEKKNNITENNENEIEEKNEEVNNENKEKSPKKILDLSDLDISKVKEFIPRHKNIKKTIIKNENIYNNNYYNNNDFIQQNNFFTNNNDNNINNNLTNDNIQNFQNKIYFQINKNFQTDSWLVFETNIYGFSRKYNSFDLYLFLSDKINILQNYSIIDINDSQTKISANILYPLLSKFLPLIIENKKKECSEIELMTNNIKFQNNNSEFRNENINIFNPRGWSVSSDSINKEEIKDEKNFEENNENYEIENFENIKNIFFNSNTKSNSDNNNNDDNNNFSYDQFENNFGNIQSDLLFNKKENSNNDEYLNNQQKNLEDMFPYLNITNE